jgi:hypothetical protein
MATHDEENETLEDEIVETEDDGDDLRQMIRDEIRAVLRTTPGDSSVTDTKQDRETDDNEPLSLRAVESSVRRIVEEAMIPLREAQKKATPKKVAPKKEPETAPEPVATKPTRKLTELLWGPQ